MTTVDVKGLNVIFVTPFMALVCSRSTNNLA